MSEQKPLLTLIRPPFLIVAIFSLLTAMWGGLWRAGLNWSLPFPFTPIIHGPLMVCAFLGTLISLERAVALNKPWGYAAPFASAAATVFLFTAPGLFFSPALFILASLLLAAIMLYFLLRNRQLHFAVMFVAPLLWLGGNLLWYSGKPFYQLVLWWASFLVVTVAGERLELSRILKLTTWRKSSFVASMIILIAGTVLAIWSLKSGIRVYSIGLVLLGLWLLKYDLARKNIRLTGLSQYLGWALIPGYIWLCIGGITGLISGAAPAGPLYDAFLHSIFVGFVFSMIFGHAPVIFPAILQRPLPFHPRFYLALGLLHLSLLIRIIGDLLFMMPVRLYGSYGNVAAILLFLMFVVWSLISGKREATN